jgi:hypothetical protein
MVRFVLLVLACVPLLLQGWLEAGPLWPDEGAGPGGQPDTPPAAAVVRVDCPRSREVLGRQEALRTVLALPARGPAPAAGGPGGGLDAQARRHAADLAAALGYAAVFREEADEDGAFPTDGSAFRGDPVLWGALQEARFAAREAARVLGPLVGRHALRPGMAPAVRAWLARCKETPGALAPFGAGAKRAANGACDALAAALRVHGGAGRPARRARQLLEGWQGAVALMEKIDGAPPGLAQLELLGEALDLAGGAAEGGEARAVAAALYRPLLPAALPPDGEVILITRIDNRDIPERAARSAVRVVVGGREVPLGPGGAGPGGPDEFALNEDPAWATRKKFFRVFKGASGFGGIAPTPASLAARAYTRARAALGGGDWPPEALGRLRQSCAPHRAHLGEAWANLEALHRLAARRPGLFAPAPP